MRILLVEDDQKLCELVSMELAEAGMTVDVCHEGDDGLRWMKEQVHDVVLLDRMLPRMDGVSVLRGARAAGVQTPVILVTALGQLQERIEGLDTGADDYITKPFAVGELLARIRAVCRRPRQWESAQVYQIADITFDPEQNELRCGASVVISKREGELLEMLLRNAGQTLPRETLLSRVWGPDYQVEDSILDNYIHFLRKRLKAVGSGLEIKTVRGVGYRVDRDA